ncbi:MAG: hypothetical protein RJQ09_14030 [Cyclobacteriaceae bacterium]
MKQTRKKFIQKIALGAGAFTLAPTIINAQEDKPQQLDPKMVQEFVSKSHSDISKVKELFNEEPNLLYCSHDWGGGDFETGIEAAGHVGNKEVANFLIEKGARISLFTAAMLGNIEMVRPALEAFPGLINSKGPHGFTLLHHANKGKEDALEVKAYLESLGAKETKLSLF